MIKKIIYLVVLILLSLCVVERVRLAILDKCVYPVLHNIAENNKNYMFYIKCGQIKLMAKEYEEARDIFMTVLREAKTTSSKREKLLAYYYLGNTFYESEDYDKALKAYVVVLKNEPNNRKALRKFSRIKMAKGEYASLYPFISAYIKKKPNDSFGYSERCAVLTRLNKFSAAKQDCEKALQCRKSNARAHHDYAVLLEKQGFKDLAAKEYKEANAHQRRIKSREELEKMLNIKPPEPDPLDPYSGL